MSYLREIRDKERLEGTDHIKEKGGRETKGEGLCSFEMEETAKM